jgi:hypothetical protein
MLTLWGAMPREDWVCQLLCADLDGFGLHAAAQVEAHDRKRLEQLCRDITRPRMHRHQPRQQSRQPPPSAKSRPSRQRHTASAGRGCSSVSLAAT